MRRFYSRVPPWGDWAVALGLGIIVLNLNVTAVGDPLSGVGLSAGPTSPGITETGRVVLYGTLGVGGAAIAAAGLVMAATGRRAVGSLVARTFGFLAGAGLAGLLLDYRDGPVRTIHLVVYVAIALAAVRLGRVTVDLAESPAESLSAPAGEPTSR